MFILFSECPKIWWWAFGAEISEIFLRISFKYRKFSTFFHCLSRKYLCRQTPRASRKMPSWNCLCLSTNLQSKCDNLSWKLCQSTRFVIFGKFCKTIWDKPFGRTKGLFARVSSVKQDIIFSKISFCFFLFLFKDLDQQSDQRNDQWLQVWLVEFEN